ncbi:MAG: TIGR03087 family PEP-CTERM/XrtA system glycosyltransferase [Burkholderiaceae bacterium]|nr:TIGR03087 family PEP-CTERM/XrtA system glycosyltransferase [Burkholderiaceae bacterium]
MANLLFLVHRLPYPPNKGDKLRSFNLLKQLAARHRVFVGTFIDDPEDEVHVDSLRALCAGLQVVRLHPVRAKVASLSGLIDGQALTLRYYRDSSLRRWAEQTTRREHVDAAVVFSSSMAQYAQGLGVPTLVDFVDIDSAKWAEYAPRHHWPLSWLYRREGRQLLAYERAVAAWATCSFFVTEKEVALFLRLAPECAGRVEAVGNGVDADHYAPQPGMPSPFQQGDLPIVFTGAMDYWPNADAVTWFATEMLPRLRVTWPRASFHIVGRNPTLAVRSLACDSVHVTGTVPDVRPYLQNAAVVVAPLRLARGIQNKVLEAMAMGRPVVAARACTEALTAEVGAEVLAADDAEGFVREIDGLLRQPARATSIGAAGRARVLRDYSWRAHLASFERHLEDLLARRAGALAA